MAKNPFRIVYLLWVAPDFKKVLAGIDEPPWINHDRVDFQRLRDVLAQEFRYGEPVRIRVANDTIDQVTVHTREAKGDQEGIRCHDFAKALLEQARKQPGDVIDVRQQWSSLHQMKDRRAAPPPIAIPIVVEGDDFEAAVLWSQQAKMLLGVRAANPETFMGISGQRRDDDHQGRLTPGLHEVLAEQFSIAYKPYTVMDIGASDPQPKWATRD